MNIDEKARQPAQTISWRHWLNLTLVMALILALIWIAFQWHLFVKYKDGIERGYGISIGESPIEVVKTLGMPTAVEGEPYTNTIVHLTVSGKTFDVGRGAGVAYVSTFRNWYYKDNNFLTLRFDSTGKLESITCMQEDTFTQEGIRGCPGSYSLSIFAKPDELTKVLGFPDAYLPDPYTRSRINPSREYYSLGLNIETPELNSPMYGRSFGLKKSAPSAGFISFLQGKI